MTCLKEEGFNSVKTMLHNINATKIKICATKTNMIETKVSAGGTSTVAEKSPLL